MDYHDLYALLSIATGKTAAELDAIPLEDLEIAADNAVAAARKWLQLRGYYGDGNRTAD